MIGVNEEATKALPVLLAGLFLLWYRKVKLDVRMWMFLGTVAGLTFGIAEQAFYTSTDIVGIHQAQSDNEAVTGALAFAERIFVDGFQHAVWAGIAGFFIGMALNYARRRVQLVILGVAVPAVLHALNDFLASSSVWLVILIQAASLLLFLGYTLSAASIEQRVRETPLFRGQSMMMEAIVDPDRPPSPAVEVAGARSPGTGDAAAGGPPPGRRRGQGASSRSLGRTSLPISSIAAIGSGDMTWIETMSAPTSVTSGLVGVDQAFRVGDDRVARQHLGAVHLVGLDPQLGRVGGLKAAGCAQAAHGAQRLPGLRPGRRRGRSSGWRGPGAPCPPRSRPCGTAR